MCEINDLIVRQTSQATLDKNPVTPLLTTDLGVLF